jgi:hypothetical protein
MSSGDVYQLTVQMLTPGAAVENTLYIDREQTQTVYVRRAEAIGIYIDSNHAFEVEL